MEHTNRRRGVTLLEVMIAMAILIIVAVAFYGVLAASTEAYATDTALASIQDQARKMVDDISEDFRLADRTTVVIGTLNGSGTLTFRKSIDYAGATPVWSPTDIVWQVDLSDVDANNNGVVDEGRIVRTGPAGRIDTASTKTIEDGAPETVTKTHYVKSGGLSFTANGSRVLISVTLMTVDAKGRVIETTVQTSVTPRNSSN